ncbi:glycosyltransferase family 2 protein [Lactobacillus bombicola]|uniref:Glycosyl transferase n=1 Tax=Lactobacillus bombicola TaxID=1505723 RepID=A0A396T1A3_9LACO|nr:glycosyltransferase family 2 protein [Lactobacillus bombicola]RHW50642.1 glycosyl transferase [Lactobacillus bombicola]RHW51487.1 glycosyl transferase [Lactobacillus bombicola]RHW54029.1 glycosyl transferase [Lactobacillus bombicola]
MDITWSTIKPLLNGLFLILISYPILGGLGWFVGGLCYRYVFRNKKKFFTTIAENKAPFITIMIPAHNEQASLKETVTYLLNELNYNNYEVLVIDDCSTDRTPQILQSLQKHYSNLRVIRVEKNKGKAHAFNVGVAFAKGELVLSNDADTIPEPDALNRYVNYFNSPEGQNIAAVTSNVEVRNRTKLITKSITVEFSSIVGIIKRAEMGVFGSIFAYSGANTMYRKSALMDVGLFRQDRATEDISIAWDHQLNNWLSVFAPNIISYTLVPETLKDLYHQRKRWAKGGTEVWLTNLLKVLRHPIKNLGESLLLFDQTFSILWSFFFAISSIIFVFLVINYCATQNWSQLLYLIFSTLLLICFEMIAGTLQLTTALLIDTRGNKLSYILFAPIYLLCLWVINTITIITTFIPAVKTILGYGSGTWVSPTR